MNIQKLLPQLIEWEKFPSEKIIGKNGFVISKTQMLGEIKVRLVEYSTDYFADHWCEKGHLIFIAEGELIIEHKDHSPCTVTKGMSYVVGDNSLAHKAKSFSGAKVFIVD